MALRRKDSCYGDPRQVGVRARDQRGRRKRASSSEGFTSTVSTAMRRRRGRGVSSQPEQDAQAILDGRHRQTPDSAPACHQPLDRDRAYGVAEDGRLVLEAAFGGLDGHVQGHAMEGGRQRQDDHEPGGAAVEEASVASQACRSASIACHASGSARSLP